MGIELLAMSLHLIKKERISLCNNAFIHKNCTVLTTSLLTKQQFSSAPGSSGCLCCMTKMCLYLYTYFNSGSKDCFSLYYYNCCLH